MDYGKLAYLKADDITKRVDYLERKSLSGLKSIRLGSVAAAEIADGFWTEAVRFGSGSDNSLTILLKLRFEHSAATALTVTATLNGAVFLIEDLAAAAGVYDYFAIAVAAASKDYNNYLRIGIEGGEGYSGKLISYDAVIWGDSVGASQSDVRLAVLDGGVIDGRVQKAAAAVVGGDLVCWLSEGAKFVFSQTPTVISKGVKDFDMAWDAGLYGLCFAVVDEGGALNLITGGKTGGEITIEPAGVSSVAVMTYPNCYTYLIAYVMDGKGCVCEVGKNFTVFGKYPLSAPVGNIESVSAVNDADRPMLLLKAADNKIYFKSALPFFNNDESILRQVVTVSFTSTAIPG